MDDLYDNLENYNDVNIVEELKTENKGLKSKLEELSNAMVQLQKNILQDFDKLNNEYKKLEINYSSLLKTARAEIQRKTEMINNLNIEKDKIILSTMQKTGKNVTRSNFYSKGQTKNNDRTTNLIVDKDKQDKGQPVECVNQKDDRVEVYHGPSVDSVSNINTENKSTCNEERVPRVDTNKLSDCDKSKNKENLSRVHPKDANLQNSKINIIDRMKSIAMNSFYEAKFSSDEDLETKNADNRKSYLRNDMNNYEWQDTRDYRTEPYEQYEPSKESSRSRTSKYSSFEYKNVDEYEPFPRQRRHYSPERNQQRYTKEYTEYTEYYPLRADYGKQRAPRSPPSNKYNRSKSRDRRFNYDREYYRDNHSTRYYEHAAVKHKIRNDLDEPTCKRQKTESHSKYSETNSYFNEKDRELAERTNILKPQEYKQTSSCQSPDHVNVDSNFPQHFVKEIMNTAATNLEDPRISSKKYILNLYNDCPVLSTVVGRNIDMKLVDKCAWGLENFEVPAALAKPMSEQGNDNLLKEIYMDIENPGLHDSLESGEIQSFDDGLATLHSREINKEHAVQKNDKSKYNDKVNAVTQNAKEKVVDKNVSEKSPSTKFKIPKIKKPDKTNEEKGLDNQDACGTAQKNLLASKDVDVKSFQHIEQNNEDISDKLSINSHKSANNIIENSDTDKSIVDKRTQDIMRTIEGDLELSDEASDIVEFHKDTENKSNRHESNIVLDVDKDSTNCPNLKENNSDVTAYKFDKNCTKKMHTNKSSTKKSVTKDSSKESNRKRKSKRKTSEQKETDDASKEQNGQSHIIKNACDAIKVKEKESKETVSKQTLNKFSDLFGDSSSLITPDDLGLNNIQVQSVDKYTSIFDNTQDAVDMSVEDISNTLTNTNKGNTFDTVLDKMCDEKVADAATNHFSVNVTVVDDNGEINKESKNVPSSNVYENARSEILTNEPSVVKTVIISSGVQPECVTDNTAKDTFSSDEPSVTTITNNTILKKCPLNSIKALATSTPQKCTEPNDVSASLKDSTCNIAPTEEVNASSNISNSSNLNSTAEAQNDADIPDVRIFVRRRRKFVKKVT